MVLQDFEYISF